MFRRCLFNSHFPRQPTQVSQYQNVSILDLTGAKDDGGGGDNWSYKMHKAPVKSSPPTNHHPNIFTGRTLSSCHPTDSVRALKGEQKLFSNTFKNISVDQRWTKTVHCVPFASVFKIITTKDAQPVSASLQYHGNKQYVSEDQLAVFHCPDSLD